MPTQRPRKLPAGHTPLWVVLLTLWAVPCVPAVATDAPHDRPSTTVTAGRVLHDMLALIRDTPSVAGLTPEDMSTHMGLPVKQIGTDHFGAAQPLSGGWAFSIERQQVPAVGPRLDLIFSAVGEGDPSPGFICTPDFEQFTSELERMGFVRQRTYGEHGRWTFDAFDRHGQHVEVYPLVDASSAQQGSRHECVSMVLVR